VKSYHCRPITDPVGEARAAEQEEMMSEDLPAVIWSCSHYRCSMVVVP
jgi:hypothetical protein